MSKLRPYIPLLIIFCIFLIIWTIFDLFISGGAFVAGKISPKLVKLASIVAFIDVVFFLPLSFFSKTKLIAMRGFNSSAFIFGISVWVFAFVTTYNVLGVFGIFLGLIFVGVGIIPLGIIAALVSGLWQSLNTLIIGMLLVYITRLLAKRLEGNNKQGSHDGSLPGWTTIDMK